MDEIMREIYVSYKLMGEENVYEVLIAQ